MFQKEDCSGLFGNKMLTLLWFTLKNKKPYESDIFLNSNLTKLKFWCIYFKYKMFKLENKCKKKKKFKF